ncbi:MAG: hypothetical protein CVV64_17265 [Candidatus Wallbacteria bacterium HGW-Wallbacteria-1]|jgi:hypothetical protein|uniref:Uncharacterized protein n=1 Tax=Candidatus Wallbacteria bacterium HGW-Wallbacteria-1 TaxID=2013854 RepID=A0A2N1PK87_9BACT|nr:MAG: hypothetical protein CVV64_17265 [Candidatus Wallbacteria bacterium HGW-Wallbacteria-1]
MLDAIFSGNNRVCSFSVIFIMILQLLSGNLPVQAVSVASLGSLGSEAAADSENGRSETEPVRETIKKRLNSTDLAETIIGALVTLDDTQIRDRVGRNAALVDSTEQGDGAKGMISVKIPFFRQALKLPVPSVIKMKNRLGEWASTIHFMPTKMGIKGMNPVAVLDSNLFMTAFVTYPLYLFREPAIDSSNRRIAAMRDLAVQNIESYRRDDAFNFWALIQGTYTEDLRSGPFNIPVKFLEALAKAYINPRLAKVWAMVTRKMDAPPADWVERCLSDENPTRADALFNIPNDSDDTSTAVAIQKLYVECDESSPEVLRQVRVDMNALDIITRYRDVNRTAEDGRDSWKGKNSGAYLTWLLSESQPTFSQPEKGVIPLGVNNVDCVVNANVLFSLSANNMTNAPGYMECIKLCAKAIELRAWPGAGLYYPQEIIFPYSVTRAWRDGGMADKIDPESLVIMKRAMKKLLADLIIMQEKSGAFPGGEDKSDHLSTALALTSMLNIGRDLAVEAGLETQFGQAVEKAVSYLLKKRIKHKVCFDDTLGVSIDSRGRLEKPKAYTWESGLFFAASFWDLAHWRSRAFTVSMVLEALSKYALAYDLGDVTILKGRRLILKDASSIDCRF